MPCEHRGCADESENKERIHRHWRGERHQKSLRKCVQSQSGQDNGIFGWGRGEVSGLIRAEGIEVDPTETAWGWIIKKEPCM